MPSSENSEKHDTLPELHDSEPVSMKDAYIQSRGVSRMEAVAGASRTNSKTIYIIGACLFVFAWAQALDYSTTYNYDAFATSDFQSHSSGLGALSIATGLIGAVAQPFLAKISDITARPYLYIFALCFYVVGYIIVGTSNALQAYIAGKVFVALGNAGLTIANSVIVADLTPLEWRGFMQSVLASPYIINVWFAGEIVEAMTAKNQWRWGYGMFAIILPVVISPAIAILIYLDRKAQKEGLINLASSGYARRTAVEAREDPIDEKHSDTHTSPAPHIAARPWHARLLNTLVEIDAFGLLLLGFGWALLLLPFSLQGTAQGGFNNPSLIAMFVVGGLLLISYFVYEVKFSKFPSAPRRLLVNRTFIMAIIIDFFYYFAGYIKILYFSSYVFIVQDWSVANWTYFNNTLTVSLCLFGLLAGAIQRYTHRYKLLQIIGLIIKFIAYAINLRGSGRPGDRRAAKDTATLVISEILVGLGGSFSVIASQVASQASVPHQDVALAIAMLALWTAIGGSIGSAIASIIWGTYMPANLRKYMPASVTDEEVTEFFHSIVLVREYGIDTPIRQAAILAYEETMWYLTAPAVVLSLIPIIAACLQTNYYLGKQQNAVMNVGVDGVELEGADPNKKQEGVQSGNWKERILRVIKN